MLLLESTDRANRICEAAPFRKKRAHYKYLPGPGGPRFELSNTRALCSLERFPHTALQPSCRIAPFRYPIYREGPARVSPDSMQLGSDKPFGSDSVQLISAAIGTWDAYCQLPVAR